jgi:hypothetical protein
MKCETTKWRIHIGAHKTATTHLQDLAAMHRNELISKGIDFISRPDARRKKIPARAGRFDWRYKFHGFPLLWSFEKHIKSLRTGPSTVVLSEENFLGKSAHFLTPVFYPEASYHLRTLSLLSQRAELSIFLSIRPQASIIPSAFVETLRSKQLVGGFEPIRKQLMSSPPSWLTLVRNITKIIPNAHLSIWTMDNYLNNKQAILSHFCGVNFPLFDDIPPPPTTKSPSAEAIRKIERLKPAMEIKAYRKEVALIIEQDQGKTKFAPFTESEQLLLSEQYHSDILAIKQEFPNVLFEL